MRGLDERVSDDRSNHTFPVWAREETCRCGQPAAHKVEEVSGPGNFHPMTAYMCCGCFTGTVGRCETYPYDLAARPARPAPQPVENLVGVLDGIIAPADRASSEAARTTGVIDGLLSAIDQIHAERRWQIELMRRDPEEQWGHSVNRLDVIEKCLRGFIERAQTDDARGRG